ncbi:NADPH-dependent FMN reductase [Streptomyces sp. NPDC014894]|uniref:NADPH-dependent FMN reductase n=1 Tax=unclassified Streptomyces TaxID=2593676 RepID=UPI0037032A30
MRERSDGRSGPGGRPGPAGSNRSGGSGGPELPEPPERCPPLRVAVIVGSTREGRAGGEVARWFTAEAGGRTELELSLVDLIDFDFPARYPDRPTEHMSDFADRVARADAFVVVTPEYNRSFPASLKQAIDYAYDEWQAKPVAFVSYGHGSRGLYAVEQLRSVFTELHTVPLRNAVGLNLLEDGWEERESSVRLLLDQLGWWGLALREARAVRPYVS